jgi:hypothetical protein
MTATVPLTRLFLAATLLAAASCSAPADETWLRVTSITNSSVSGEEGEGTGAISSLAVDLRDGKSDRVDLNIENSTVIVGVPSAGGVTVTVYRAVVDYDFNVYQFPTYQYPVTLALPPTVASEAGLGTTSGTLGDLPVVPASLKQWMLDPAHIPSDITDGTFEVQARITIFARTDEGREVETSAGLTLLFRPGAAAEEEVL